MLLTIPVLFAAGCSSSFVARPDPSVPLPQTSAPAITANPASVTVIVGQTAIFSVNATSNVTLEYQWQKNGVTIAGATAVSYVTPPTRAADDG